MKHEAVRWEYGWDDPCHAAVCWERARERRQHSQRINPDEASWALVDRQSSSEAINRRWGRALLHLVQPLLTVAHRERAGKALPGAEVLR